jgi:short subunit fatty acids transporter
MKTKYIQVLSFVVLSLMVYSCKEKININIPDGEPKLVVEAEISTEVDSSFVRLTKSANYYSSADYLK